MKLLGFQEEDVEKLSKVRARLLGHDMGTGKTVMGIALDHKARQEVASRAAGTKIPPTLIVAPLTMLSTWEEHLADWEPDLRVCMLDRKNRSAFVDAMSRYTADVYLMHWDVVRLIPELADRRWTHVIGDEIHRIGNRDSQLTQSFKSYVKTLFKTGASGSPAETRPQDLWSVLHWLYPKEFSSFWRFFNHYVVQKYHTVGGCQVEDCEKFHKNAFREICGIAHEDELHEKIFPFYARRLKEDVLEDFPDKYYTQITVDLDPQQRRVYNQMRDEMLAWIGKHEDEPLAAPAVIAKLVRLQQLSAAYAQIETVAKRYKRPDGTIDTRDVQVVRLIEPSSKLDAVMQILLDYPDKQFVVFSVSRQTIELLAKRLERKAISFGMLTGLTPEMERTSIRREFQDGKRRVFIGTIRAGGQGITLTAASTVIFLDREWSAMKNTQAEDRCWRIGQTNAVQVIDVVASDTVDLGRLQRFEQSWTWLKRLLGDKVDPNVRIRKEFEGVQ